MRPRRLRALVSRAALARRLPAAVAVRGVVPVAGAHGRADRAHGGGGDGGVREPARARGELAGPADDRATVPGAGASEALLRDEGGLIATLVAAADPTSLADGPAIGGQPGEPRERRRRGPARGGRREEYELLVEAIYEGYLLHYGSPRVVRAPEADLRAAGRRPAVRDRAWRAWSSSATRWRWPSWPTRSRSARSPRAPGDGAGRRRVGGRRARRRLGDRARPTGAPRSSSRPGAPEAIEAMRTSAAGVPGVALNPASILFAVGVRQARKAQVQVHRRPHDPRAPSRARRSRDGGS